MREDVGPMSRLAAALSIVIIATAVGGSACGDTTGQGAPSVSEVGLPIYADGTARLNAMLGASLNVTIPAGVYIISGELNVRSGQVIAAATAGQVILKAADAYAGRIVNASSGTVTIRNITFDGNYSRRAALEGSVSAALVVLNGSSSAILENNQFQYAPSYAVWTYRANQMQVRGNTFLETYHAMRIDGADLDNTGVIENNTFKNTAAFRSIQHIEAVYTKGLVVRGNTMSGVGLQEPTTHGYEGTWGNSIYVFNSSGLLVENNNVGKNYWSSIVAGQNTTDSVIRGNSFMASDYTIIAVWMEQVGAMRLTLDRNTIEGGISVGDTGGDYLTITNNVVRARNVGIDVSFSAKNALIQGNKFYSTAGRVANGMYLWEKKDPNTSVRVLNNHFEGFDNGIAINNAGGIGNVHGISLSGNTFANNNTNIWVPPSIVLNQPLGQ
jgi:hypothetical protein